MKLEELELELKSKLNRNQKMDIEIKNTKNEIEILKDELLEAKMNRIAMYRISENSFERLIRSAGYVKSIYGYPEMSKKID